MRPKKRLQVASHILAEKPVRKKLTKNHRTMLDAAGIPKSKGGRKKRPESKRMLVLTTIEMAHAHGHPLTLSESRVKNPDRKKSAFVLASELTGVTPEAARNIYKTRSKKTSSA